MNTLLANMKGSFVKDVFEDIPLRKYEKVNKDIYISVYGEKRGVFHFSAGLDRIMKLREYKTCDIYFNLSLCIIEFRFKKEYDKNSYVLHRPERIYGLTVGTGIISYFSIPNGRYLVHGNIEKGIVRFCYKKRWRSK